MAGAASSPATAGLSSPIGRRPPTFNPRTKKALELSLREAIRLKQPFIAGEHLALGLLREGEGVACQVIATLGVPFDELRRALEAQVRRAA